MAGLESLAEAIQRRLPSLEELQHMSWGSFIAKYMNIIVCFALVLVGIYRAKRSYDEAMKLPKHAAVPAPDFPTITELEKFDWASAEPPRLWPFNPKYHMTMADASVLESLDPNNLILMDKTYKDNVTRRRRIIKETPSTAIGINDESRVHEAVAEFYSFTMGTYLPLRYPRMFQCHHTDFEGGSESMLQNLITGELMQTRGSTPPTGRTPTRLLLSNLGKHLDEDIYFLLPAKYEKPGNAEYVLEAYESCRPSVGFNPREKLGKVLKDIHGPVPGYDGKLEASMDRFLNKLEVGKYVVRVVWSIAMVDEFSSPGTDSSNEMGGFTGKLDPDQTFVRCERQTLHRLPHSKAIILAFKTYTYPLRQIKEETTKATATSKGAAGTGTETGDEKPEKSREAELELAQAIDAFKGGVLPESHFYRDGVEWGDAVKSYLRS